MHRIFIENYIKQIDKKSIYNFALQNNINLTEKDVNILYHYLHNNWQDLLSGNQERVFLDLSKEIDEENFWMIKSLFKYYFDKYQNLL